MAAANVRPTSRQVLIASVAAGAGHHQAAQALQEAWRARHPQDSVEHVDVLEFTPKLYRKVYVEGYLKLVKHAPQLWGMVFKRTDNPSLMRRLTHWRRTMARLTAGRFIRRLRTFRPQAVLCTHYLPLEILGQVKGKSPNGSGPLTVSIVTDFEAHALWMEPSVDLYCVAADETKSSLVARGVASGDVSVTGIPIAAKFSRVTPAAGVRKTLGLRDDLPVLLVLGGGFGLGPVPAMLRALNNLSTPVQVLVVTGRNERLRRDLALQERRHPTHLFGFVSNMHEMMAASDLVLTKPGGLTSSEALAVGRPLVVLDPIPGQEAANSDFLLEHGAAIKVNRVEDLPGRLEKILGSPKLDGLIRAARSLGKPQAAGAVCEEVATRLLRRNAGPSKRSGPVEKRRL